MANPRQTVASPKADKLVDTDRRRGRGARTNRAGRFEAELREDFDDGWGEPR